MVTHLSTEQLERDLSIRDLTDPGQGRHAIQLLVDRAVQALAHHWNLEVRWCPGPRIVSIADNYDHLRFSSDAISRDARYTRYVDDQHVLRSHSSAMIPPALRALAGDPPEDLLVVCPGVVYRRDAIDRLHTGTPHQLDIWRVARRPLGDSELSEMIAVLLNTLVPGLSTRVEPRVHPYTLAGRQVDVSAGSDWVEVWECGLAHPLVLVEAGLAGYGGLALGMGLDRLLMLAKDIPDIRLLRSGDPRVVGQMNDLSRFRAVSLMPAIRRDLSVAVDEADSVENLGDRVREALGAEADAVEEVGVLAEAHYSEMPEPALQRIGMLPGQKNVLVRIVLRHLERTLTDDEANAMRDRVYAALHRGTVNQWTAIMRKGPHD